MLTKEQVLAFVNGALNRGRTTIDTELLAVLKDLSALHVLRDVDTTQTIDNASPDHWNLNYPDNALGTEQAIIQVTLTDTSGLVSEPLRTLKGGFKEYLRLMGGNQAASVSVPHYQCCVNRTIYVLPPPAGSYAATIYYYRYHDEDLSLIEFEDNWENAIKYGVTAEVAGLAGLEKYAAGQFWLARYAAEKEKQRIAIPRDAAIVE